VSFWRRGLLVGVLLLAALASGAVRCAAPAPAATVAERASIRHTGTSSLPLTPAAATIAAVAPASSGGPVSGALRPSVIVPGIARNTVPAPAASGTVHAPAYLHTFNLLI
jgi:hypothetical protein